MSRSTAATMGKMCRDGAALRTASVHHFMGELRVIVICYAEYLSSWELQLQACA